MIIYISKIITIVLYNIIIEFLCSSLMLVPLFGVLWTMMTHKFCGNIIQIIVPLESIT